MDPNLATSEAGELKSHGVYEQPTLQNVVATADFGQKLNLMDISLKCRGDFDTLRFAAASLRLSSPKTTSLVFGSGKIVCTGAKTVHNAKIAVDRYYRLIASRVDPSLQLLHVNVQNMVAKACFGQEVKLTAFSEKYMLNAVYDDLFPGLRYKLQDPKLMVLIFLSGRVVMTGAKTWEEIIRGWEIIRGIVGPFLVPVDSCP